MENNGHPPTTAQDKINCHRMNDTA